MSKRTRLALVRHGETAANIERVWHGQTDTPLTDRGHHQARQLGNYFQHYMTPDVIYASPLQRAHITAKEVANPFGLDINLDSRLMEFHLGDWEGIPFSETEQHPEIQELLFKVSAKTAPNGESVSLVRNRMVEAIEEITSKHSRQNIVLVAHGAAIAITLAHYLDNDISLWRKYHKGNTAFSELCLESRQLLSFNQTLHLQEEVFS